MVVFPLLSRPMMIILSYFLPDSLLKIFVKKPPIPFKLSNYYYQIYV